MTAPSARALGAPTGNTSASNTPAGNLMTTRAWLLLVLLSLLWGGSFFTIKIGAAELPPFTLVAVRVALAAAALHVVLALSRQRMPLDPRSLFDFAVMGLANNVLPFALITYGEQTIPSGLASILNAFTPIATVIIAHLLTRDDRLTAAKSVGVGLGFAGVATLVGPGVLGGIGHNVIAEFAVIAATVSYGLSSFWSRRFRGRPPMVTATGQLTASAVLSIPLALVTEQPWTLSAPSMEVVLAMLFLALVSTSLAYVLFFRIITLAGASNVMLVTFMVPVWAILLGAVFLGERLDIRQYAGLLLIVAGLSAIDGRLWRQLKRKRG